MSRPKHAGSEPFCSLVAQASREDPLGTATPFEQYLLIELPPPWPADLWRSAVPQSLLHIWQRAWEQGKRIRLLALAPDPAYSVPGYTRVLHFRRPAPPFATFERAEYMVPEGDHFPLAEALLASAVVPERFAAYRCPNVNGAICWSVPTARWTRAVPSSAIRSIRTYGPSMVALPAGYGCGVRVTSADIASRLRLSTCPKGATGRTSRPRPSRFSRYGMVRWLSSGHSIAAGAASRALLSRWPRVRSGCVKAGPGSATTKPVASSPWMALQKPPRRQPLRKRRHSGPRCGLIGAVPPARPPERTRHA